MNSANQIMEGMKESTGIDLQSLISGLVAGSVVKNNAENTDNA